MMSPAVGPANYSVANLNHGPLQPDPKLRYLFFRFYVED